MIVYRNNKKGFQLDVERSKIDIIIGKAFKEKLSKEDPEKAKNLIRKIIKNTYRTLMTRGIKGSYVWAEDPETNAWLKTISV